MFEITVTEEFARWFDSLEAGDAEQIASALDLVGEAGPALDPVRASRLLLWYDGMAGSGFGVGEIERVLQMRRGAVENVRQLMLWHEEVLRCLQSRTFHSRLTTLDGASAARAFEAIDRLQRAVRAERLAAVFRGIPSEEGSPAWVGGESAASLKRAFLEVLRLVGLEPGELIDSSSGLRELTVSTVTPHVRVIYGIDVPNRRALALVGEPLTRAFYGDSVRLAERRWAEYLASGPAVNVAP